MSAQRYNSKKGRHSIRHFTHNYADGGDYFVTPCAHREYIEWSGGVPFGHAGSTRMSPVHKIIQKEMENTVRILKWMTWGEYVIMPDHFHAIIKLDIRCGRLSDVITGFKAGVTRMLHVCRGDILVAQKQ